MVWLNNKLLITNKRGFNQLDWIISLVFFMMFLAFTFIIVSPHSTVFLDEKAALNNLKYGFIEDYTYSLSELPVYVDTKRRGIEPVIFPMEYFSPNIFFDDGTTFSIIDNELIFILNITDDITQKKIILSNSSQKQDIVSNKMNLRYENGRAEVATRRFYIDYLNTEIKNIYYNNVLRIKNITIKDTNEQKIVLYNRNLTNESFAIVLKENNNDFVFKQYMFYDMSRLYLSFNTNTNFIYSFDLYDYNEFYFPVISGNLLLNETMCFNVTTDYFDFGNGDNTITIRMSPATKISTCTKETDHLKIILYNPKKVDIYFSDDAIATKYNNTKEIDVYSGILTQKKGVSVDKLNQIKNKSVSILRTEYAIDEGMNFELMMSEINYTNIFDYSFATPRKDSNVFIKRWHDYLLYQNASKKLVLMGVKVWQ